MLNSCVAVTADNASAFQSINATVYNGILFQLCDNQEGDYGHCDLCGTKLGCRNILQTASLDRRPANGSAERYLLLLLLKCCNLPFDFWRRNSIRRKWGPLKQ